jgi:hypothetical protein
MKIPLYYQLITTEERVIDDRGRGPLELFSMTGKYKAWCAHFANDSQEISQRKNMGSLNKYSAPRINRSSL